ncbi:HamA C-terminal domain-containing protein [Massilia putida]|uniref:HamA C-terminal domain-containing protein n=1 Tax=Massilia putida TaxID=1141883 RepID=UPI000952C210|nr:DUF1837 domain-containing protein [Massilia putida]
MDFEILIDDSFLNLNTKPGLSPLDRKHVLSLVNGFEDGKWQFSDLHNFVWDNIAETALSERERASLVGKAHSQLTAAARNLRLTDKEDEFGKGSELAEIVLYGIMKKHYDALPVVPKIFYKQNAQDNAKGADSVHLVIANGDFSLWLGEAKFYNSIDNSRLASIIQSVGNALDTNKLKKENSIVTNLQDIQHLISDEDLRNRILSALAVRKSIDELVSRIHIPILLIHECAITAEATALSEEYIKQVRRFHRDRAQAYFESQIAKLKSFHKYPQITFHLILFPVPDKKKIIDKFIANVEYYKDQ